MSREFCRDSTKKQGLKQGCSTASFHIPPIRSDSSSFAILSILWLVATIRRIMSTKEHHNQYCQDISPFRIEVFCHKCGKDDFRGNTRSLSSHVRYCKPNKITTQSNLTRRNQQDKVALLIHDSDMDLFFVFGQEMQGSTPKCTSCATQIEGYRF